MNFPLAYIIRAEKPADYAGIFEVNKKAFEREEEARLVGHIRNGNFFIPALSLVAVYENKTIGHILLSKISIIDEMGNRHESLALAPMAVDPEFQKIGIGTALIKRGLDEAKAGGFVSVIVLGHEHYYPKFGFVSTKKWKIRCPFEVPAEAFMAVELQPNALLGVSGMVVYPSEFSIV